MLIPIALLSVLILFLEMLLIRWIGTEVRIFAYLQNGVLIAAFLGLGLGCRSSRQPVRILPSALGLLFVALVIRDPFEWNICEGLTRGLVVFQHSIVWHQSHFYVPYIRLAMAVTSLVGTASLLLAVAYAFYPLGQLLGEWMDAAPRPILAYTVNLLGSLVGIGLFTVATLVNTPPRLWVAAAAIGYASLVLRARDWLPARLLAGLLLLGLPFVVGSGEGRVVWSPYQKLSVQPMQSYEGKRLVDCGHVILVNNTGYQLISEVDPQKLAATKRYTARDINMSHYTLPHRLIGSRNRVLVVGSGAGNDVAAALAAGAGSVHAVEIDPRIVALGRELHPDQPYASPRVKVTVDDARAFFRRAQPGSYDLIWFGLLDSHTNPSAYSNVRLDHFVYTRESFAEMKRLLAPGGMTVLFFEAATPWIADRLGRLLTESFGTRPLSLRLRPEKVCLGWGGLMLIGGARPQLEALLARARANPDLGKIAFTSWPQDVEPTTDDWPYLYLPYPMMPAYHLLVAGMTLALAFALRRRLFRPGEDINVPMLLLGAGFMLLEVSGVSRAALLFGTTWTVNAYVVGAMLTLALLANLAAARLKMRATSVSGARTPAAERVAQHGYDPTGWPFLGLAASIVLLALLPSAWLVGLPGPLRVVVGGVYVGLPVFFSGLLFVSLWAVSPRKDLAFGSNLLGSLLGGIASLLTMFVGFRGLTLLTLAVYLPLFALLRRAGARS